MPCETAFQIAGLLVYLPLDTISSGMTEDASPNNHDGMILGGAGLAPGRRGMGILLDGGSKAISLGSPSTLDNLPALTVCAWVNPSFVDAQKEGATIADKSSDGYSGGWNAYLDYDPDPTELGLHVGFLASEGQWGYGRAIVEASTWTHACTTWSSGAALTVYANGTLDVILESGTVHGPPAHDDSANPLVLGRATSTNQFHLNGTLDDFLLYDRVLTAGEIASIHACTP